MYSFHYTPIILVYTPSCTQMVDLVKDPEGETVMQSGAPDTIQSPTTKFKSSDPNKNHNDDEVIKLRQRLTEMELKLAEVCVYVTNAYFVSSYVVYLCTLCIVITHSNSL